MSVRSVRLLALCLSGITIATALAATAASAIAGETFYGAPFTRTPGAAELADLGRRMFFDPGLSASGRLSCASCHDPDHAFAPANGRSVQPGGLRGRDAGLRAVPSLRYLQSVPPFTEHRHDSDGDDSIDQGPAGGRTWDGRAQSVHDQARLPLLSPREMANGNEEALVRGLRKAAYARDLRQVFGADVLDKPALAFKATLWALEVFQQTPDLFYPYDSKYDAYLRGQTKLSAAEARGLKLFNDADKGNCASCHPSAVKSGALPAFTDFGFVGVGVPRNPRVTANRDSSFFDLGLCGPERTDLRQRHDYCGLFRTPTLRNVATRRVFFHNGVFRSLEQVLAFYVERDPHPEKWYPRSAGGRVRKFDDLPRAYQTNVNHEPPFGRSARDPPALTRAEIGDVIAFLRTLNDGYRP